MSSVLSNLNLNQFNSPPKRNALLVPHEKKEDGDHSPSKQAFPAIASGLDFSSLMSHVPYDSDDSFSFKLTQVMSKG